MGLTFEPEVTLHTPHPHRSESGSPPSAGPASLLPGRWKSGFAPPAVESRERHITHSSRWHRQHLDSSSRLDEGLDDDFTTGSDHYQDSGSAGSLVSARRLWLALSQADTLLMPQRFTFMFRCITERMAAGLTEFLRYADYAGYVRIIDRVGVPRNERWQVVGTTNARTWSLPTLESLFMRLREAGSRYVGTLETLDLVPRHRADGDGRGLLEEGY